MSEPSDPQPNDAPVDDGPTSPDPAATEQLFSLLDKAAGLALDRLPRHATFLPYAVALQRDGEHRAIAVEAGEGETTLDVLARLEAAVRARRDEFTAVGVAVDSTFEGRDAVDIRLEHRELVALSVFLPYERTADEKLAVASPVVKVGTPRVWG